MDQPPLAVRSEEIGFPRQNGGCGAVFPNRIPKTACGFCSEAGHAMMPAGEWPGIYAYFS